MNNTEDVTRTVDEGNNNDENGRSSTVRSKKVNRRRKQAKKDNANKTVDQPTIDTTSDHKSSPKSESTNRSTSSISSSRNENADSQFPPTPGVTPPARGTVKRFFLKFTEKMGGIEKTEYSQKFNTTCKDFDDYKVSLEELVECLIGIAQRNPKLRPPPPERMQFDYYDNENPYEQLLPTLRSTVALFQKNPLEKQMKCAEKLGTLHRDFHRRCRRALRDIRQFLCNDYVEMAEARRVLNQRRQDMDYAKHELKNAKAPEVIEMKNTVYEHASKQFEVELSKVLKLFDKFPRQRENHLKNVQNFFTVVKIYHEQMAAALKVQ